MKGLFRKLTSGAFRWGRGAVILALCAAVLATAAYAIYSATAEGEGEVTVASYTQSYTLTDAETGEELDWSPSMRLEAGAYRLRIAARGTARTGFCVVTTQETDGMPVAWYTAPVEPEGEVEIELTVYTEGRISMDALWGELSDYWPDAEATAAIFIGEEPVTHAFQPVFEDASHVLYRVGSGSAVELGDLFRLPDEEDEETEDSAETEDAVEEEDEPAPVDSKALTVTAEYFNDDLKVELKEEDYVVNEDDWKKSTIKLTGAGPVLITLREGEGEECELLLEVVDGVNVTEYADLPSSGNIVLLSDIELPEGGYITVNGAALYGNGFTVDASACTAGDSYAIRLHDGELNNVAVNGPLYDADAAEATRASDGFALVRANGESRILGCCLTGGAAPLRVVGGEVYAESTALCGGSFANISYFGGDLTLKDVVTVNQADAKLGAAGLGIAACGEDMSGCRLTVIGGSLTQYNSISDEGIEETADTLPAALFGEDGAVWQYPDEADRDEDDPVWVSAAIVSVTDTFGAENIIVAPDRIHEGVSVSDGAYLSGYAGAELGDGYVYAPVGAQPKTATAYTTAGQFDMAPAMTLAWPTAEDVADIDEEELEAGYFFYDDEEDVLRVFYAPDGSYELDPAVLTAEKFGLKLVKDGKADKASSYRVTFDGEDITGGSIDLSGEDCTHRLEISFTDPYNYSCRYGTLLRDDHTYTIAITVVAEPLETDTAFAFGAEDIASVTEAIELDGESVLLVLPAYAGEGWESMTFAERTVYYPVVEMRTSDSSDSHSASWQALFPVFADAVTITIKDDDGETVVYDANSTELPAGLSAADAVLYDADAENTETTVVVSDGVLCIAQTLAPHESGGERSFTVMYRFTDAAGQTYVYFIGYHCAAQTEAFAGEEVASETTDDEPEDVGSDDPHETDAASDPSDFEESSDSEPETEDAAADDTAGEEAAVGTETADATPEDTEDRD